MNVIVLGATGMVGEGVLLECLENLQVSKVLVIGRRKSGIKHQKVEELLIPDLLDMQSYSGSLTGFNACFYCIGKTSNGMSEQDYTSITFNLTIEIATVLKKYNPNITFCFVSGSRTDSTEKGKIMWARVKGKTENALIELFGNNAYNFRPALMKPSTGQKNFQGYNKLVHKTLFPLMKLFFPHNTIQQIAQSMIFVSANSYSKQILEVSDINHLRNQMSNL
jgi:uncharacterized protein YbjT (DUF2867 family)